MTKQYLAGFIAICATLAGCSGGGGDNTTPTNTPQSLVEHVTVRGVITTPDGATPLVNATVYVADKTVLTTQAKAAEALTCDNPSEAYKWATCTDEAGAFSITLSQVAAPKAELTVKKGAFFTVLPVTVDASTPEVDLGAKPISEKESLPTTTKIAVVTGWFDRIEDVLAKTGLGDVDEFGHLTLGTEKFDLFDGDLSLSGGYPFFDELMEIQGDGQPKLMQYDIVFINCGAYEFEDEGFGLSPSNPELVHALRAFVAAGGRLYITDQAYDYLEQAFPEYLHFYGGADDPSKPEPEDAAQYGMEVSSVQATVLDKSLSAFLAGTTCEGKACVNPDGTLKIEGFLPYWAVLEGVHKNQDQNVTVYIKGPATLPDEGEVIRPLTVAINHGAGKIVYSSYHTEDRGSKELLPQERVLQYLVFE